MYDVITVGSATVDALARTEFCETIHDKKNEECIVYPVGAKILMKELIMTVGGGGTNTAVSLSRLGHKVAFLGKIGSKYNSGRVIHQLKKENVNTSLIIRSKTGRTGYSIVLDSKNHDRTILTFRGSNRDLKFSEVKLKKLKTKWFYFSSMIGTSFRTLEKIANYASKNNIKIAFNISSYLAKKGKNYLKNILKKINILVLNKEEAALLVGKGNIENLLKKISKLGPNIVSITDGKHGAYALYNNQIYCGKSNKVKIVETTGAGDAFASSFVCGIIKKGNIGFAMKLGMTNAESVIQHHGAKEKLLTYNAALKIMKKRPISVIKKTL
ncbi:MAG: carbohydrate kinase family protein [Candidatus Woesearchaeota archaeon]|jgi:ribokinase|nr:carbohydrate kinase family protein [Candidatus Woesearchaeota archaeon]MDP7322935.1 carbohydrate kinase family protein [Candidatus Woesearchaeota archaeon]MDP7476124.1 carbohydrate kinase family protein [Candidatus Woesearchaeota archaeon]HJO02211.1 carbohydrate kinase family protein [Candidatus Woesearchaeota archaeon]|tara:strand:+ start:3992 stop:4972 length:981 start_codon:yes stop_codon:yes gene_type:complete